MKRFVTSRFDQLRMRLNMRGESIVETLAAVLICSLAILMLYTALASAARMNTAADAQSAQLRDTIIAAEMQQEPEGMPREVTVAGYENVPYVVDYYGGKVDGLKSYRLR